MSLDRRVQDLEEHSPTPEDSKLARAKARQAEYERIQQNAVISPELAAAAVLAAANEPVDLEEAARVERGLEEYFGGGNYEDGYGRTK
jgi:hypothetical protein